MSSDDILTLPPPPADARLSYGTDPNQFGDLRLPKTKGPSPIVMNIHGGYWRAKYDLAHAGHLCAALTAKGVATWNIEYRRVGNPGGGWPGTFEDVRNAYRYLPQIAKRYDLDSTQSPGDGPLRGRATRPLPCRPRILPQAGALTGGSSGFAASVGTTSQQQRGCGISRRQAQRSAGTLPRSRSHATSRSTMRQRNG